MENQEIKRIKLSSDYKYYKIVTYFDDKEKRDVCNQIIKKYLNKAKGFNSDNVIYEALKLYDALKTTNNLIKKGVNED